MSRSGYSDDCDGWELIRWRGTVAKATKGARGQTLLRELLEALDAMPQQRLIEGELELNGEVCALGCIGQRRGVDMSDLEPEDSDAVAGVFNIAPALVKEIVFMNDEGWYAETPEQRWTRMRSWVATQIIDK